MPTARELLEQADSLMRKNRKQASADIPLLVDAVAPAAAAHVIQDTASLAAAPAASGAPSAMDIPVLTDVVEAPGAAVVKEAPPIVMPGFGGDPSNWLVMDTVDPSLNSITGGAADTLSAEPLFSNKAAGSAPTPPPARSASPLAGSNPARSATPPIEDEHLPFVWEDPPEDKAVGAARDVDARASERPEPPSASVNEAPPPPTHTQEVPSTSGPGPHDDGADIRLSDAATGSEDESALAMAALEAATEPASGPLASSAAVAAPGAAIANEDARWHALAEQISMQVLQRVDLFTDEGLREQLAGRLQPIMARASAELVDTITGHVGQLLRTYVAEAIEREIAAWRRDQP
jgi:hypothetical protein